MLFRLSLTIRVISASGIDWSLRKIQECVPQAVFIPFSSFFSVTSVLSALTPKAIILNEFYVSFLIGIKVLFLHLVGSSILQV